ncbi:MAG TPA: zf-HC2 domain-containing protein [Nocardioidaceae bacterium]
MSHDDLAHLDAAYVLGALDPGDRRAFEEHLRSCSSCAQAVRDLELMPRLLGRVDESAFRSAPDNADAPAAAGVPDTLLPRLLKEVRRQRRQRRSWLLAGAAAAAVVVAGGVLAEVGQPERPDQPGSAAVSVPMDQVGQEVVRARLAMEEVPWGTRLELTCRYETAGYRDAEASSYALVVQSRDGSWEQVATWRAVPGRSVTVTGATAARSDDIASVEVRSAAGRVLLALDSLNG